MEAGSLPELARAVGGPPPLPPTAVVKPATIERHVSPLSPEYRQAVQVEDKPRSWMGTIAVIAAALVSVILSKALGGVYWMPVLLITVSIWVLTKAKLRGYAAWMLGVLVGQTLWMAIGHVTLYATDKPDPEMLTFLFDLCVVFGLTVWGARAQSVAVCVCVLLYQIIALGTNVVFLDEFAKVSAAGVGMHMVLRTLGIGLAIYAIVRASQHKEDEETEPLVV